MTSSDDDDEMLVQRSRSNTHEIAADVIVVSTGSADAEMTREVISIDPNNGEVVDAVVGDGTSEDGDDERCDEDDDDEEYQESDDASEDSNESDGSSSVQSIEHSSVVSISSELASPSAAVTTKRKRSHDAGGRNDDSQDDSTEDADAKLVQPWQKRRQRLWVEKQAIQQQPVTKTFADGGCISIDSESASAVESVESSEPFEDPIRQVQRRMMDEWGAREQQRQKARQFEDSGIGMGSDMPSGYKDVSVRNAIDGNSSPEVVSIVSSQVINVPSSPPMLRSSSRGPTDVPSSPPIFPVQQEDDTDDPAARVHEESSPKDPVSRDEKPEPELNQAEDGVRIVENPVPWSRRCVEMGQHIDIKNRPMVWSTSCRGFNRSTSVRPTLIRWMDWWSTGCPLCQWRGSSQINHRIEECDRDEARTIAAEAARMDQEIRFGRFSCCFQCGVPQVICKRWQGGQACQYTKGILTRAIVTMLQEGKDDVSDDVYRWMGSSGADIGDRKSVYAWFGERYHWGGIEMSRLVRTFYKLVARHEK